MAGRCDDLIGALVAQHSDLPSLLTTLFEWLHRRSDLYVVDPSATRPIGFQAGEAERLLLRAFRTFPYRPPPAAPAPAKQPAAPAAAAPAAPAPAAGAAAGAPAPPAPPAAVRYTDEGKQIPVASGGVGPGYWWEQTLTTATLHVLMPAGTPSRAVECAVGGGGRHLRLALRGAGAPIVDARLPGAVRTGGEEGLVWNLETPDAAPAPRVDPRHGCHLPPPHCGLLPAAAAAEPAAGAAPRARLFSLFLDKVAHTWWRSFVEGGPEIDAQRVDSTQPISAYDEDTQAAIRKAMAEQAMKHAAGGSGGIGDLPL